MRALSAGGAASTDRKAPTGMDDEPRDDQPCLFAPERDGAGYRLTRRSFLAAAAVGAAQSLVGCGVANHATGKAASATP